MKSQLIIGSIFGITVGLVAWRLGALNLGGALMAVFIGVMIYGFGGLEWAVLMLSFFVSSSALSQVSTHRNNNRIDSYSKGVKRDWGQVIANGGLAAFLTVLYFFTLSQTEGVTTSAQIGYPIWVAYAGTLAAVTADTWATELGANSRTRPKLITNGKRVEPGTSGAISSLGTIASISGGFFIGVLAGLLKSGQLNNIWDVLLSIGCVTLGGFIGSLFDSFLGATLQAIYYCPDCEKETEHHPVHNCGKQTEKVRGLYWMNNDLVNFCASIVGMGTASGLWILLSG